MGRARQIGGQVYNPRNRAIARTGGGGGAPAPSLLAAGSTWGWIGDGLNATSGGVGSGASNNVHQFQTLIGGRLQPVPFPICARSGSTIGRDIASNRTLINPYAIDFIAAQCPDVFIMGTMGANDNVLSVDPGASPGDGTTTNIYLQDWYDAVKYALTKFTAYGGSLLVVMLTAPSQKAGEATYRTTVWNAQIAFVNALTASNSKVVLADISDMTDPSLYSNESGGQYVHLDERGAYHTALAVFNAIDAKIEAKTDDEILDMIDAGTYPLQVAANLDADTGLAGTGGTITGPGVTGTLATTKVVTNTTGATGITIAQTSTSGGRTKTVVTLAGSASGDGKIMLQDKSNLSVTGTPGQPFRTGSILRMPAGVVRNFGSDWNNQWGFWGGSAVSLVDNARMGANGVQGINKLIFSGFPNGTSGTGPFNSSTTFAGKRSFAMFVKSGQVLSGTFEMERPFAFKPSNRTRSTMAYLGAATDSFGNILVANNYKLRPTGTISQAAGGTIRVEPGTWNLFGLTEADFTTRRIYKGTVSDTAVGSGTKIGSDMTGSTWTQAFGAGVVTTGDLIYVEITDREGNTYRSTVTVTAT